MNIIKVRQISQVFFLIVFVWFCVVANLGERWWQLRGWPVNWFLQLDPLVGLGTLLTTRTLYAGLLWGLATVVLTIILGRFFCSWMCPFGSLHHFVGYLGARKKTAADKARLNRYRRGQSIKYWVLIFLLATATAHLMPYLLNFPVAKPWVFWLLVLIGALAIAIFIIVKILKSPKWAVLLFLMVVGIWFISSFFSRSDLTGAASLQIGLLDPIPLLHRTINLALLPILDDSILNLSAGQRYYEGAWFIGAIFLTAIFLNFLTPRFYCRFICPLGALFGVLSRFALWRIGKKQVKCIDCHLCETNCEGACEPSGQIRISECVLCMNCLHGCHDDLIGYQTLPSASGEIITPDVSRRQFVVMLLSGTAAIPMLHLNGNMGPNWDPVLVRPPGALAEKGFLARCIKCGQCMRICPTNIIQPAGFLRGLEGLWTPTLNFRMGTSGCQQNCIACGNVCPTSAIRPISLEEKLGINRYAGRGPIRIGTAFVDRGRCFPWAMDKPCIVCQETCPVSPKAIFTREHFSTVRGKVAIPVKRATSLHIEFVEDILEPDHYATGDYYCLQWSQKDTRPRLVVKNTARGLTVSSNLPWDSPPAPGSQVEIRIRLQRPFVDLERCVGCGICEHECPVSGRRAIRVTAENESRNREHSLVLLA